MFISKITCKSGKYTHENKLSGEIKHSPSVFKKAFLFFALFSLAIAEALLHIPKALLQSAA